MRIYYNLESTRFKASGGVEVFRDLATRIAKGSSVVFLSPAVFADEGSSTRWTPPKDKGRVDNIPRGAHFSDDWSKNIPYSMVCRVLR